MTTIGLYIHIPFCIQKCVYCDFVSVPVLEWIPDYVDALIKEIQMRSRPDILVDTIYFGGGTPSILTANQIDTICKAIDDYWQIDARAEITLEANPGTLSEEKLQAWQLSGINRLNLGIQSFQDKHLKFLGRIHDVDQAHEAIDRIKHSRINNFGLDLMYGIPGQHLNEWIDDLQTAIQYTPNHLSCYSLTYEPGTPLFKALQQNFVMPLPDHRVRDMMKALITIMDQNQFDHYEISNFASQTEFRSKHNQKYWNNVPYLGFGVSAHSFESNTRFYNVSQVNHYIKQLHQNILPVECSETLTVDQQMIEAIFLGLRQTEGIPVRVFASRFSCSFTDLFSHVLEDMLESGYIELTDYTCRLTQKGLFYLDSIVQQIIDLL